MTDLNGNAVAQQLNADVVNHRLVRLHVGGLASVADIIDNCLRAPQPTAFMQFARPELRRRK